jgi:flagellar basal body-associated protein FliL
MKDQKLMAEKAEKKPEAPAAPAAEKKDHGAKEAAPAAAHGAGGGGIGGMVTKLPVLLGGVMLIEAVVLFAGFKFIGGGSPRAAAGAELASAEKGGEAGGGEKGEGKGGEGGAAVDKKTPVEIQVVDFRAPNKLSGRTFLYDVSIFAVTKAEHEEKVKAMISSRDALIKDRVRTIIAQSDPEKLGGGSEPGLETLRRQVKYQLDEIVGDGLIDEVLVPRCIPFRTDY